MSVMRGVRAERQLAVLAASVRVRDVAEPVFRVDDTDSIDYMQDEMREDELWYGVVHQGEEAVGYFEWPWLDMEDIWTPLDACATLSAGQIVEESMPVLDLIPHFRHSPFFFGLRGNRIESVITWKHLDSVLGRTLFLVLLTEYEALVTDVLKSHKQDAISLLPPTPRSHAEQLLRERYPTLRDGDWRYEENLLGCVHLPGKLQAFRLLIPRLTLERPTLPVHEKRFMQSVARVRNQVAHGNSLLEALPDLDQIVDFVEALRYAIRWTDAIGGGRLLA